MARVRRALLLDVSVFEDVRDDAPFTPFAIGVAAVTALLGGIGAFLWSWIILDETKDFFLEATILGTVFLLLLWLAGMVFTYFILSQTYRENVTMDGLVGCRWRPCLRSSLLIFVPGIGFGIALISVATMFFYTNYSVRAAYPEIDPMRVFIATLGGFAVWALIPLLLTIPTTSSHRAVRFRVERGRRQKLSDAYLGAPLANRRIIPSGPVEATLSLVLTRYCCVASRDGAPMSPSGRPSRIRSTLLPARGERSRTMSGAPRHTTAGRSRVPRSGVRPNLSESTRTSSASPSP
jgi:hypothetical protein